MITTDLPQYDEIVEITLETVIQKEDEILGEIAEEHVSTRQSIQDVGQNINSKISMINGNIDLPLNERPTTIRIGALSNSKNEELEIIRKTDDPTKGQMFVGNSGELIITSVYRDYNNPQTHYLYTYKDGKLIQQTSSYDQYRWAWSAYITRDKTTNNICACGQIANDSATQIWTVVKGKTNVLATLEKRPYFISVFSPSIVYFDDLNFYKKDMITNNLLLVDRVTQVSSKMIWEHNNYVYYVGADGNIYRFDVNTLVLENFTQINRTLKVVPSDIDAVCYCGNGNYVSLTKSNNFLIYTVDLKNGVVELIQKKVDVRFYIGSAVINAHNLALMDNRVFMYGNQSPNTESPVKLYSKILVSINDSKNNLFLTKGTKVMTHSPITKLSPNKLSYLPIEGNEIKEDGVYSLENTDDYYTTV